MTNPVMRSSSIEINTERLKKQKSLRPSPERRITIDNLSSHSNSNDSDSKSIFVRDARGSRASRVSGRKEQYYVSNAFLDKVFYQINRKQESIE